MKTRLSSPVALIVVSDGPAHFFRPGKNSHGLEQLAGLPKTRRSVPSKQGPGKAWAAESLINAFTINHSFSLRKNTFTVQRGRQSASKKQVRE